jgi:hypothetical protein
MPVVRVVKGFILNLDTKRKIRFEPGEYTVDQEIADHWYFKAHLEGYEEPPPARGTLEFARAAQGVAIAEISARTGEAPERIVPRAAELPPSVLIAKPDGGTTQPHYFAGDPMRIGQPLTGVAPSYLGAQPPPARPMRAEAPPPEQPRPPPEMAAEPPVEAEEGHGTEEEAQEGVVRGAGQDRPPGGASERVPLRPSPPQHHRSHHRGKRE